MFRCFPIFALIPGRRKTPLGLPRKRRHEPAATKLTLAPASRPANQPRLLRPERSRFVFRVCSKPLFSKNLRIGSTPISSPHPGLDAACSREIGGAIASQQSAGPSKGTGHHAIEPRRGSPWRQSQREAIIQTGRAPPVKRIVPLRSVLGLTPPAANPILKRVLGICRTIWFTGRCSARPLVRSKPGGPAWGALGSRSWRLLARRRGLEGIDHPPELNKP